MKVTLMHHTPLWVASDAIRTCWSSHDKSDTTYQQNESGDGMHFKCGEKDKELIERVGNVN